MALSWVYLGHHPQSVKRQNRSPGFVAEAERGQREEIYVQVAVIRPLRFKEGLVA
jgi:hypothetical protein